MEQPKRHSISMRVFPPLAVWAINKVLASPAVKERTKKFDAGVHQRKKKALKVLGRAGGNALSNPAWLAAGVAAVAVGVGLMAKAALK
jgi:hypothetical protein